MRQENQKTRLSFTKGKKVNTTLNKKKRIKKEEWERERETDRDRQHRKGTEVGQLI